MSLTVRVLIGLVAGFLLGLGIARYPSTGSAVILAVAEPIGTIFINLIRMTVIPLVVSMLVASVGSVAASRALGRTGLRAAALALAMLIVAALISLAIAQPVFARLQIDAADARALGRPTTATLTASVSEAAPARPWLAQWFVDLVPQNPVKAAADGTILPVIVAAVLFGFALARVDEARRGPVLRVVEGVAETMQRLVVGILVLAPIGVFALAVGLASRLGVSAVGAVIAYVVLVVSLTVLVGAIVLYPVGILLGPLSTREFIGFCAPAQAVAFAARSSMPALPAMVESAERAGLPPVISGFLVPLATMTFRAGAAVAQTVGVLFLARLYGVPLAPAQLATVFFTVILTTFTVPAIPGGSIISMVPVLNAANLPIEGIGILLAVDAIPDMFRTTENVTGALTLAAACSPRKLRRFSY